MHPVGTLRASRLKFNTSRCRSTNYINNSCHSTLSPYTDESHPMRASICKGNNQAIGSIGSIDGIGCIGILVENSVRDDIPRNTESDFSHLVLLHLLLLSFLPTRRDKALVNIRMEECKTYCCCCVQICTNGSTYWGRSGMI